MWHIVWLSLLISVVINVAMFLVAYRLKSDKLTDISYAVSFVAVTLFAVWRSQISSQVNLLLTLMVCLWAIRIGGYLLIRIFKKGRDKRFDGVRENFLKFGQFWLGQAITVWVLLLPVELAFGHNIDIKLLCILGVFVWAAGLLIETFADYQKYQFSEDSKNKGRWIESGLWGYSRHPNYFGEILVWAGIYLFSFSSLSSGQRLIGLLSPALIIILLRYISGIPPLEASADKRWGKDKAYISYRTNTNLLIPSLRRGGSATDKS